LRGCCAQYRHPVFVYLPPGAEVRGGAWVVLDTTINVRCIEMYADPTSRAGILEPEGTVHVKFGVREQRKLMARLVPVLRTLDPENPRDAVEIHQRQEALLPTYLSVAHTFADLHDRSGRMLVRVTFHDSSPSLLGLQSSVLASDPAFLPPSCFTHRCPLAGQGSDPSGGEVARLPAIFLLAAASATGGARAARGDAAQWHAHRRQ
jgi:hypothetical protein